ncbi:TIGR04222 domain-containing membrane protein [Micromonospora sp. RTP1Z1]|uniref:TIGR04222 domain-containing membrane protein n=1 Tax=Micromonospora sp. RTP1Z1 TaxID=2994043 RepID=UPI0029C60879|nr:TIGR04222 domain-containing membrane protein [Micromonospora sp. RTP1Z1]
MLWGVSGPLFLLDYVAAVAGALAVALSIRSLTGWRTRGELTTVELAYLTDRAGLACQVGMAALRRAGAVRRGELSTLSVDGPPPAGSAPLVRALHAALRRPQTWAAVLADPAVGRALRRLVGRLVRDGWLLTPAQRRRIAVGTLPLFAVAAVGVTRLVDSAVEGRTAGGPASVAGLLLCCLATALAGWWLCEVPETGRPPGGCCAGGAAPTPSWPRSAARRGASAARTNCSPGWRCSDPGRCSRSIPGSRSWSASTLTAPGRPPSPRPGAADPVAVRPRFGQRTIASGQVEARTAGTTCTCTPA